MKKEYKHLIISTTLGLMEGNHDGLRGCLIRRWERKYPDVEAQISVNLDSLKYVEEGPYKGCGLPKMTATLLVDGEVFSFVRDWEREHLLDSKKPEFYSDDYFFESDNCQSHIDYLNALKEIGATEEEIKNGF